MKPIRKNRIFSVLALTAGLMSCFTAVAHNLTDSNLAIKPEDPVKKEKKASRTLSPMNNESVKIHPAIIKREMHVVAKENAGAEIDFFVFDLQGTLVQHYKMKPRAEYKLSGLKKGKYLYSVFRGDEETVSGKFEVR